MENIVSIPDRYSDSSAADRRISLSPRVFRWLTSTLLWRTVERLVAAYIERRRIMIAIEKLHRWDDRSLRDIGLHRMDIERMVRMKPNPHRGVAEREYNQHRLPACESGYAENSFVSAAQEQTAANDNQSVDVPPEIAADRK